ncbi:histidine phosphotransferase hpt1p [Ceraceosorus bombacis]|uniref:Histidine phosphotransferase hpt1p n=1 Tax=Ceraceosorus bombacis TaxID=401625 RepID=A0A0P1BL50_9BASI|nr:histidine phosphotransferase hpt1p [Ceraceosorus bombacis]
MADANAASTSSPPSSPPGGGADVGDSINPEIIDMDIFSQLLEMDDDEDDREFSREIVWNYFDQAAATFVKMDKALEEKSLLELSTLGHFLKGSSAAVGVSKVRDSCENMQHYGKQVEPDGATEITEEVALEKLTATLKEVKVQYKEAEEALRAFYKAHEGDDGDADD